MPQQQRRHDRNQDYRLQQGARAPLQRRSVALGVAGHEHQHHQPDRLADLHRNRGSQGQPAGTAVYFAAHAGHQHQDKQRDCQEHRQKSQALPEA